MHIPPGAPSPPLSVAAGVAGRTNRPLYEWTNTGATPATLEGCLNVLSHMLSRSGK